jgi:hypothetical protein
MVTPIKLEKKAEDPSLGASLDLGVEVTNSDADASSNNTSVLYLSANSSPVVPVIIRILLSQKKE